MPSRLEELILQAVKDIFAKASPQDAFEILQEAQGSGRTHGYKGFQPAGHRPLPNPLPHSKPLSALVLEALEEIGQPVNIRDLAHHMDVSQSYLSQVLQTLKKRNQVDMSGSRRTSLWSLPETGSRRDSRVPRAAEITEPDRIVAHPQQPPKGYVTVHRRGSSS